MLENQWHTGFYGTNNIFTAVKLYKNHVLGIVVYTRNKMTIFALNNAFPVYTFIIKFLKNEKYTHIYSLESHGEIRELIKTYHIIHLNLDFVFFF